MAKTKVCTFSIGKDLDDKIRKHSKLNNITISDIVRSGLNLLFEKLEQENKYILQIKKRSKAKLTT